MSRVGNMPILIPEGVLAQSFDGQIVVNGSKGELKMAVPEGIKVEIKDGVVMVGRQSEEKKIKAMHGLVRSLIANMIIGVSEGWSKNLELIGIGYRAVNDGGNLSLNVGFSHPVEVVAPEEIHFEVKDNTKIIVTGIDKAEVGRMAAKIRNIKPPEPYQGKGIRYEGERVRRKAGKAGKVGAGGVK